MLFRYNSVSEHDETDIILRKSRKGVIFIFQNQKFMTCGVRDKIPLILQALMWELIENLPVDKDYLQVFLLSAETSGKQRIKHIQEEPAYEKEYELDWEEPVTAKIFVIDDETHSTMLLASEY